MEVSTRRCPIGGSILRRMKFELTNRYDVDPETLMATFADADFQQRKGGKVGHRNITVEVSTREELTFTLRLRRDVPAEVPSFAKKFIPPMNTVLHAEDWTLRADGWRCVWSVDVLKTPVTVAGTGWLKPRAGGTDHIITGTVTANLPIVGKKIAKVAADQAREGIEAEGRATRAEFS